MLDHSKRHKINSRHSNSTYTPQGGRFEGRDCNLQVYLLLQQLKAFFLRIEKCLFCLVCHQLDEATYDYHEIQTFRMKFPMFFIPLRLKVYLFKSIVLKSLRDILWNISISKFFTRLCTLSSSDPTGHTFHNQIYRSKA